MEDNGYENDISADRLHHEIYLSDARRVAPEKLKTVIRHPIKNNLYNHQQSSRSNKYAANQ